MYRSNGYECVIMYISISMQPRLQPTPRQSTPRKQPGEHDSSCSSIRPALGRAGEREHPPSSVFISSNLTVATPDQ